MVLAKLLKLKVTGDAVELADFAEEALKDLPGLTDEVISAKDKARNIIEKHPHPDLLKTISEIFREKALAFEQIGRLSDALESFEIALHLAKWVDENEGIFSFEFVENLNFLQQKINQLMKPLQG